MNIRVKIELRDDSEFNRLLEAYQKARSDLHSYLWNESITTQEIRQKETVSGN